MSFPYFQDAYNSQICWEIISEICLSFIHFRFNNFYCFDVKTTLQVVLLKQEI